MSEVGEAFCGLRDLNASADRCLGTINSTDQSMVVLATYEKGIVALTAGLISVALFMALQSAIVGISSSWSAVSANVASAAT